jgi:hypothetical protein
MHTTTLPRPSRTATTDARHLLVIANETLEGPGLLDAVEQLIATDGEVLVVCPVLVGRSRYWTSDLSAGISSARERLLASLASLRARGIAADGIVGDDRHAPARALGLARAEADRARPVALRAAHLARGRRLKVYAAARPRCRSDAASHASSSAGGSGRLSQ